MLGDRGNGTGQFGSGADMEIWGQGEVLWVVMFKVRGSCGCQEKGEGWSGCRQGYRGGGVEWGMEVNGWKKTKMVFLFG